MAAGVFGAVTAADTFVVRVVAPFETGGETLAGTPVVEGFAATSAVNALGERSPGISKDGGNGGGGPRSPRSGAAALAGRARVGVWPTVIQIAKVSALATSSTATTVDMKTARRDAA